MMKKDRDNSADKMTEVICNLTEVKDSSRYSARKAFNPH